MNIYFQDESVGLSISARISETFLTKNEIHVNWNY